MKFGVIIKRFLAFYLIVSLNFFCLIPACYANEQNKILFTAEKVDPSTLEGIVNKRILKKYIPVELTIENKGNKEILLSNQVYYVEKGKKYLAPASNIIYSKTKKNTICRAIFLGVPLGFLTFVILMPVTITAVAASSISSNNTLQDNIKKYNYKSRHVFDDEHYSTYIFIPKKRKKANEIIIKGVSFGDDSKFDLKTTIIEQEL